MKSHCVNCHRVGEVGVDLERAMLSTIPGAPVWHICRDKDACRAERERLGLDDGAR